MKTITKTQRAKLGHKLTCEIVEAVDFAARFEWYMAKRLRKVKDNKAWEGKAETWKDYAETYTGKTVAWADQLIFCLTLLEYADIDPEEQLLESGKVRAMMGLLQVTDLEERKRYATMAQPIERGGLTTSDIRREVKRVVNKISTNHEHEWRIVEIPKHKKCDKCGVSERVVEETK